MFAVRVAPLASTEQQYLIRVTARNRMDIGVGAQVAYLVASEVSVTLDGSDCI